MVEEIWRYPVKSAQGEPLIRCHFDVNGPEGDRAWACISGDGVVVSAKHPRRWGRLLFVSATILNLPNGNVVTVHIPECPSVVAGTARADELISRWLGEEVTLTNMVPAEPVLHRSWPVEPGMIPDWATEALPGQETVTPFGGPDFRPRFVDYGAVHMVTTDELAQLRERGVDADIRRFRPNLVLSLPNPSGRKSDPHWSRRHHPHFNTDTALRGSWRGTGRSPTFHRATPSARRSKSQCQGTRSRGKFRELRRRHHNRHGHSR